MSPPQYEPTPFGHEMRQHFSFAPGYRNLNHGSFGASPVAIRNKANELRDQCEATPCPFIKYRFPELLDESRAAISNFLDVPESTIVFVPNATTGVNTVMRNMVWSSDGKDEILQLDIIYGACGKTTSYICEANGDKVRTREISFIHPVDNSEMISAFRQAIKASRMEGYRPRIAIFDTISSNPGLRLPFEELTAVCRSEGVLSLIDAAHGIGQVDLNLSSLDPDFLISNCHKWLFTPRSCAVFYVPERNQAMMRSTLPTSHGFITRSSGKGSSLSSKEPVREKTEFVSNFEFVGTADNFSFLTVPEAIRWRQKVCGGEIKIREYCIQLAYQGGQRVADILGTVILDNAAHTSTDCFMVDILLPIKKPTSGDGSLVKSQNNSDMTVTEWMQQTMIKSYKTFMPVFPFQGSWWVRLSAQIYLEISDFDWAGWTLKDLCKKLQEEDESDHHVL
ncbi:Pyridoxal phosphate-dependent transferase major region subdomain 1 [Penicillium cf. griseofulvum]|uniref:Pyridoxal phosphate-dependent transferase major region subdomain 1 n=1 Tax=Penicillium cf. griseofulvum TaxID=2972120 RepID=A0A9W9M513_9EURO|nr:Pyridoxal phosphate-dependent transferase major region subdomain 1 [Penicillium cf. griseofulvum]KAJ5434752.1 Pyridoxal phosphate-dependent transferase major region subdomain 1 [Penicillium cf. griseofulvum]